MNTRSFLKALATIAVAPQILIPKAPDAYRWAKGLYVPNPAWESATYEISWGLYVPDPIQAWKLIKHFHGPVLVPAWLDTIDPVIKTFDGSPAEA